jgi:acetyl-CoA C-acetyltransferase
MMNKIAVGGVYQTKFGELWDKSLSDLISEAVTGCLKDTGISAAKVESVFIGNMLGGINSSREHLGALVSQVLQTDVPVVRVEAACASGGLAVRQAVLAIASGEIETALVIGAEKMTDLDTESISAALMSAADDEEIGAGLTFPGLYALLAQAYMAAFAAKEKDFALVAVKNHFHAQFNQKAQFPFAITVEDVLSSRKVADPLKMLDCSPVSDGAAAVFLSSVAWMKKHQLKNSVYISGSAQAQDSLGLAHRSSLVSLSATEKAAQKAFFQAGITPQNISCVEVHDCFTIAEVLALEDLGLFAKGEGYAHLTKKETWLGGKQPVNTSGGLKACGHPVGATGVKQIVEATLQLRREAKGRQVENSQVAVTQNIGGTGGTAVVHVLTR